MLRRRFLANVLVTLFVAAPHASVRGQADFVGRPGGEKDLFGPESPKKQDPCEQKKAGLTAALDSLASEVKSKWENTLAGKMMPIEATREVGGSGGENLPGRYRAIQKMKKEVANFKCPEDLSKLNQWAKDHGLSEEDIEAKDGEREYRRLRESGMSHQQAIQKMKEEGDVNWTVFNAVTFGPNATDEDKQKAIKDLEHLRDRFKSIDPATSAIYDQKIKDEKSAVALGKELDKNDAQLRDALKGIPSAQPNPKGIEALQKVFGDPPTKTKQDGQSAIETLDRVFREIPIDSGSRNGIKRDTDQDAVSPSRSARTASGEFDADLAGIDSLIQQAKERRAHNGQASGNLTDARRKDEAVTQEVAAQIERRYSGYTPEQAARLYDVGAAGKKELVEMGKINLVGERAEKNVIYSDISQIAFSTDRSKMFVGVDRVYQSPNDDQWHVYQQVLTSEIPTERRDGVSDEQFLMRETMWFKLKLQGVSDVPLAASDPDRNFQNWEMFNKMRPTVDHILDEQKSSFAPAAQQPGLPPAQWMKDMRYRPAAVGTKGIERIDPPAVYYGGRRVPASAFDLDMDQIVKQLPKQKK